MKNLKNKKLSVVITGWYFKSRDPYKKLLKESKFCKGLDISYYIASHRKKDGIKKKLRIISMKVNGYCCIYPIKDGIGGHINNF